MNKKYLSLGVAAVAVIAVISWKVYIDQQAEKRVAEVIQDASLDNVVSYKGVSAGWLANSVTIKDVSLSTGGKNGVDITAKAIEISGINSGKDGELPKKMAITIADLNVPIVKAAGNDELTLTGLPTEKLASLGYTRLQGDVQINYANDADKQRLKLGMGFDFDDLGKAETEIELAHLDVDSLVGALMGLAGASNSDASLILLGKFIRSLTEEQLSGLALSFEDDGLRERVLLTMREEGRALESMNDFSKTLANDMRKKIKDTDKGTKGEAQRKGLEAIADFIEDGGRIKGETHIEKPIQFITGRGMWGNVIINESFTDLGMFVSDTGFRLSR